MFGGNYSKVNVSPWTWASVAESYHALLPPFTFRTGHYDNDQLTVLLAALVLACNDLGIVTVLGHWWLGVV